MKTMREIIKSVIASEARPVIAIPPTVDGGREKQSKVVLTTALLIALCLSLIFAAPAAANNITVTNVSLHRVAGQPTGTIGVKFDLAWDNSFTTVDNNGKAYYDRAWVFIKYWNSAWDGTDHAWGHATLIAGGTVGDYTTATGVGIASDKKGAFCKPGIGQILYWNYGGTGGDGLAGTDSFTVKVMAIEMVYVPEGAFYLGSGGTESGSFTDGSWLSGATIPLKITSEDALNIGPSAGKLWGISTSGNNTIGSTGTLSADYPKGYKAFYMMKYELSQGQYRDFLNTLTRAQQVARVVSIAADYYALPNTATAANIGSGSNCRNGIRLPASVPGSGPITFGCDYDHDQTYNETTDGEWIACNYLSWADLYTYADWAGLRPMTELEFEKASRGPVTPVANEYVWGNTAIAAAVYTLSAPGEAGEAIDTNYSTTSGNAVYGSTAPIGTVVRGGIFAANASNTGRITSGASYYGIMELPGHLWERPVTVGNAEGRAFTGVHGDGDLSTGTVTGWPVSSTALGVGCRGGRWNDASSYARVSDRVNAAYTVASRINSNGVRCVRTE
ncbi:MAG: SUMF1/EgtB/PvdO family nonheme iron enzyme [Candidatus Omnitrophica bacterium]|nr:SUMF1/EgtB/PvdO family nonheme iron enzyme [Candidatus Omnitrophota bacterium]